MSYQKIAMKEINKPVVARGFGAWSRMESCIAGDPVSELAEAMDENNLRLFVDILCSEDLDVNKELGEEYEFSTVLHLAVSQEKDDFVRELARHPKINPNISHKSSKNFPIHVAAEKGQVTMLEYLLEAGADVNAKLENGSTALHVLALRSAARWAPESKREKIRKDFVDATKVLLSRPEVNVDSMNNLGITPLYFAIDKGTQEVTRALLDRGACVTLDIDGDSIEELLQDKMPDVFNTTSLDRNRRSKDTVENRLFQLLYLEATSSGQFAKTFEDAERNNNKVDINADDGTFTFLMYACDQGLHDVVAFLLQKGADPNLFTSSYQIPPVVLAGHHGYYKIIKAFIELSHQRKIDVDFAAVHKNRMENVLHKVIKAESKAYVNLKYRDYDRCLNLLLDPGNRQIQRLMQPAIDAPDHRGNTPLHHAVGIGREEAVRRLLRSGANIGLKNKDGITPIDKMSTEVMEEFLDECLEGSGVPVEDTFKLTFKYAFLGPPLRRQWKEEQRRLKEAEDDAENDGETSNSDKSQALPEAEPLWYLSQSPPHRRLLLHPIISSFVCLKWRRMRPYYYTNLAFYLLFVVLLTSYLLLINQDPQNRNLDSVKTLKIFNVVLLIVLTLREVFQAMVSFRRYIFNLENLMEISMITILYITFFGSITSEPTLRSLSGAALLLCWTEMVLLFGRHPKLSTFITMFSTVSMNFFLFLTWYISFIIAFGLVFFIVLQHPTENAYFVTPSKALLKTIVMSLTGEIEFEGIEFGGAFPVILFLLYVFFIMLVLMNLLNGLAVSDISEIQKHAEIVSISSRVELISYMESMLLGDPFDFLTNWPPVKWLQKLPACSCLNFFYALSPVRKLFDTLIGETQLFQSRLKSKKAVFEPNLSRFEASLPGPEKDNLVLDSTILRNATDLVVKRQASSNSEARMEHIEKAVKLLAQQNNFIIEMLQKKS